MKEATAKRREKPRADKDVEDVEMKEDEQRAPREQDQLTLDGQNLIYTSNAMRINDVMSRNNPDILCNACRARRRTPGEFKYDQSCDFSEAR